MIYSLIEGLIRHVSGRLGIFLRRVYYNIRLGRCGKKILISEGVYFDNPKDIEIGDYVWIDRNVILIAGKIGNKSDIRTPDTYDVNKEGKIVIGSYSHLGIGTIIQGHGGILIGENFTSSAYCKIYTLSNDPFLTLEGTIPKQTGYSAPGIINQIIIGQNVWLGLSVSVLCGTIGSDTFIKPNAVINGNVEENSIVDSQGICIKKRFSEKKS